MLLLKKRYMKDIFVSSTRLLNIFFTFFPPELYYIYRYISLQGYPGEQGKPGQEGRPGKDVSYYRKM